MSRITGKSQITHGEMTAATVEERLRHFDEATKRQRADNRGKRATQAKSRGWTREELYDRGRVRLDDALS